MEVWVRLVSLVAQQHPAARHAREGVAATPSRGAHHHGRVYTVASTTLKVCCRVAFARSAAVATRLAQRGWRMGVKTEAFAKRSFARLNDIHG